MGYDLRTKNGYDMYEMSSMIQKAIRRCDIPHAAYAANELSVKYRKYLWKRLLTISAEDCWGIMTKEIIALQKADAIVNEKNKPGDTNDLFIAKAVILLCMAKKNRDADYVAVNFMWGDRELTDDEFDAYVDYDEVERLKAESNFDIPDYVYDVHTRKGKRRGKTDLDFFARENEELQPRQMSLFDYGDFGELFEHERKTKGMTPSREKAVARFQSQRGPTDPTRGGKVWAPDTYKEYQR